MKENFKNQLKSGLFFPKNDDRWRDFFENKIAQKALCSFSEFAENGYSFQKWHRKTLFLWRKVKGYFSESKIAQKALSPFGEFAENGYNLQNTGPKTLFFWR